MKNIKELTEQQAEEILEFVYPNKTKLGNPTKYDYWFTGISVDPVITSEGNEQISMGGRSLIGIKYHNGQDNCILYFDDTKVVLWLYKNGFDILKYLEFNQHLTDQQEDFANFAFEVEQMSKGDKGFREGYKQNWTLDYVTKKCKELVDKYYYKEYE